MLIIDRFEENIAVCETGDGRMIQLEKGQLPIGCKEGSCIKKGTDGKYRLLEEATRLRKAGLEKRFQKLVQK